MPVIAHLSSKLRQFGSDETGNATINFALCFPVTFTVFLIVVDMSVMLMRYGEMWTVTRDAARAVAVSALPRDEEAVRRFIEARLSPAYSVELVGEYTVWFSIEVTAAAASMSATGALLPWLDTLTAHVRAGGEPLMAE